MYQRSTFNLKLPEWYTIERNAEKSIEKLNTLRELDYYLKHPEESLRRLAILRLAALKMKDSINSLKEIMDDPVASQLNKELSAWTIKTIASQYDIDLFISHRLLTRYTGNEKLPELFNVNFDAAVPSPSFSFSAMPEDCRIRLQSSNIRIARDTTPDLKFDYSAWLSAAYKRLNKNALKMAKGLLKIAGNNLVKASKAIPELFKKAFAKKASIDKKHISKKHTSKQCIIGADELKGMNAERLVNNTVVTAQAENNSLFNRSSSYTYSIKPSSKKLKPGKAAFDLLYYLLFPVRTLLKPFKLLVGHKLAVIAALAIIYFTMAFTSYGRVTTIRYLGIDLKSFHIDAVENIKQVSGFALKEFNNIIGINDTRHPNSTSDSANTSPAPSVEKTVYTIATKKGLNFRVSPKASSAKAGNILEYGTPITYLDKSQKDSEGKLWYYITTPDGIKGWVYSGGLKEKEAGTDE